MIKPRPKPLAADPGEEREAPSKAGVATPALLGAKRIYDRRINDIYIGTKITIDSLTARRAELAATGEKRYSHFVVPSGGERREARIRRDAQGMENIFSRMIEQDERSKSLLMAVSLTEDFLSSVLKVILRAYPDRIVRGPNDGAGTLSVSLAELVEKGQEQILEEKVQARLYSAFHAAPDQYLRYVGAILRFDLPAAAVSAFIEAKATRDIIVHASGRVNSTYLAKARELRRGDIGEILVIDHAYFYEALANMKALTLGIHQGLMTGYGDDPLIATQMDRLDG